MPSLKFHQLVFGPDDLGSGAFSVVRYARTVARDSTQSKWPEYAVKIIDTKTMQSLGYEASVNREICILGLLSHPNIARLVTSFRYRDGAYLVLEYASKGDLHSILRRMSLTEDTARFFLGETVAALNAIHELGFVYGDLKPENIVITANNHAKLTDFGGCRPVTDEARARTHVSFLQRLRNGDWRADQRPPDPEESWRQEAEFRQDGRVEGTTMYLPPEVVAGGAPTMAADAWALGCLAHFLFTGKPPLWVDSDVEADLVARIVSFNFHDEVDACLGSVSAAARDFIGLHLEVDKAKRMLVSESGSHAVFVGLDVWTLYRRPRGPDMPIAGPAPAEDARWQKRQFSRIWTVMPDPQDYQVSRGPVKPSESIVVPESDWECHASFGDELPTVAAPPKVGVFSL